MKDEIKEILDKFDKKLENYELDKKWGELSVDSIGHLFPNEMKIIKDYITNLQEENERLKKDYGRLMQDNAYTLELERRNEKALDFILQNIEREHQGSEYQYMEWVDIKNMTTTMFIDTLLDILQGGDK